MIQVLEMFVSKKTLALLESMKDVLDMLTPRLEPYGGGCTARELTALGESPSWDAFQKCYFSAWFAPLGFPDDLSQFEGPSAVIDLISDTLYGFSGKVAVREPGGCTASIAIPKATC